jgi:hypothetical protein
MPCRMTIAAEKPCGKIPPWLVINYGPVE